MKKTFLVLVILVISVTLKAQFFIGGTTYIPHYSIDMMDFSNSSLDLSVNLGYYFKFTDKYKTRYGISSGYEIVRRAVFYDNGDLLIYKMKIPLNVEFGNQLNEYFGINQKIGYYFNIPFMYSASNNINYSNSVTQGVTWSMIFEFKASKKQTFGVGWSYNIDLLPLSSLRFMDFGFLIQTKRSLFKKTYKSRPINDDLNSFGV